VLTWYIIVCKVWEWLLHGHPASRNRLDTKRVVNNSPIAVNTADVPDPTKHCTGPHHTTMDPKILGDGSHHTPQCKGDPNTLSQRWYGPTTLPWPPVQPRREIHNFNPNALLQFFSKYPAMGVTLYHWSVMAKSTRSADSLADNEYLRRTSADRVFQSRTGPQNPQNDCTGRVIGPYPSGTVYMGHLYLIFFGAVQCSPVRCFVGSDVPARNRP